MEEVRNTKRILCLGPSDGQVAKVVEELTCSAPATIAPYSVAGAGHTLDIKTAYYSASISVWLDELTDVTEWQREFTKPEAKQVIDAIGAWIFCFTDDGTEKADENFNKGLAAIETVMEHHTGGTNGAVMLAVAVPRGAKSAAITEERYGQLEDIAIQHSFELIDLAARGTNEYGEKQSFERIKEALEANEWTAVLDTDDDDLEILEDFEHNGAEKDVELSDLKAVLVDNTTGIARDDQVDHEDQAGAVDDLEVMLGKLLAVKEQGTDLPVAQRKRLAAQAVREVMQSKGSRGGM